VGAAIDACKADRLIADATSNAIIVPSPQANERSHDDSFLIGLEEVNP
jgi:hypothetical protein